jgi:hypothetical protein
MEPDSVPCGAYRCATEPCRCPVELVKAANPATNAMETPATTPANSTIPHMPLASVLTVISDKTRWRIFNELLDSEPLPVKEIARRLGVTSGKISKHCNVLHDYGVARRGYGGLYSIYPHFIVPGQRALDFGSALIRLDHLD